MKKNKIKNFNSFVKEDATATMGNTGGMGNVVSANPSSTPGDVGGSSVGSGDIGSSLGTYTKTPAKVEKVKKKKKKKKKVVERSEPYSNMYITSYDGFNYKN